MSYQGVELERDIQAKCNAILRDLGIPFIHMEKGHSNKATTHRKGIADLLFWYRDKSYAVELKTKSGIVKPEQAAFLASLARQGVVTGVCRSVDDFVEFLKDNEVCE